MTPRGSDGRRVVVLGGTSEIALEIVHELLRSGPRDVVLLGRDAGRLTSARDALEAAGASHASTVEVDAVNTDAHEAAVATAFERLGGADLVLLAVGRLGERGGVPRDTRDAAEVLRVTFLGAGSLLIEAARRLRIQRTGTLVVLSSVAGERVRSANVVYGAAKAGLDALARGLGDAMHDDGVRVMVVRPGFVHGRMTKGLPVPPLATRPAEVARAVVRGLDRGDAVVWAPAPMRWLTVLLRALPSPVFRRLPI